MPEVIDVKRSHGGTVVTLWLNRPEVLNAFNRDLIHALKSVLVDIAGDSDVRVVVLRGSGRAFSAGIDIKPQPDKTRPETPAEWRANFKDEIALVYAIWALPQPVIAVVHGYCLGFACDLALSCDYVIATDDATFGEPEIRHASASTFLVLPFLAGMRVVKEFLLTGESVSSGIALTWGLVNCVVPGAEADARAASECERLLAIPREALFLNKASINKSYEFMGLRDAVDYNLELMVQIRTSTAAKEFDQLVREKGLKAALTARNS